MGHWPNIVSLPKLRSRERKRAAKRVAQNFSPNYEPPRKKTRYEIQSGLQSGELYFNAPPPSYQKKVPLPQMLVPREEVLLLDSPVKNAITSPSYNVPLVNR